MCTGVRTIGKGGGVNGHVQRPAQTTRTNHSAWSLSLTLISSSSFWRQNSILPAALNSCSMMCNFPLFLSRSMTRPLRSIWGLRQDKNEFRQRGGVGRQWQQRHIRSIKTSATRDVPGQSCGGASVLPYSRSNASCWGRKERCIPAASWCGNSRDPSRSRAPPRASPACSSAPGPSFANTTQSAPHNRSLRCKSHRPVII